MMNVNPGSVDSSLSIIEAHEKDPGFKKALEALKAAQASAKKTEAETAAFEQRMRVAEEMAIKEKRAARSALAELAPKESSLNQRELDLKAKTSSLEADMQVREQAVSRKSADLVSEAARLEALESSLAHREREYEAKSKALDEERAKFEAWRAEKMAVLAA